MIELWPSIDIIDRKNVKLIEGKLSKYEELPLNPEEAVHYFSKIESAHRIQLTDLVGAKDNQPTQSEFINYLSAISKKPLIVGGGIRSIESIDSYLEIDISQIIVGTKAISDFLWLKLVTERYPGKIFLAIDAINNEIAVQGWTETSRLTVMDVLAKVNDYQLGGIVYTDITKDGTMLGPNFEMTKQLVKLSNHPIIVSGGIRHATDIRALEEIGVYAAIIGKAAYSETFWKSFNK